MKKIILFILVFSSTLSFAQITLYHTVYVNSDGVVNDSKYDEATVGFPFLKQIGNAFYEYEIKRPRANKLVLQNPVKYYESRDPNDNRPAIKNADN